MQHNCSSSILSTVDTRLPCIDIESEFTHIKMYLPLKFYTELLATLGFLPITPSLYAGNSEAIGSILIPLLLGSPPPSGRTTRDRSVDQPVDRPVRDLNLRSQADLFGRRLRRGQLPLQFQRAHQNWNGIKGYLKGLRSGIS
jgi:hypothetical protein